MKNCLYCGKALPDNSAYCNYCGAAQKSSPIKEPKKSSSSWWIIITILLVIGGVILVPIIAPDLANEKPGDFSYMGVVSLLLALLFGYLNGQVKFALLVEPLVV